MESDPVIALLKVKTIDGRMFELEVNLKDRILDLKRILADVAKSYRENTSSSC